MEITRKKMGRPLKPATAGTRVSLGLKVTPETKERIAQAADETGRTQSQEAEYRLELSFDREGLLPDTVKLAFGELGGIVLLIAYSMERYGRHAAWSVTNDVECWKGDAWLADPTGYEAAVEAARRVLEVFRPLGKIESYERIPDADAPLGAHLPGQERTTPHYLQNVWQMFSPETVKRAKTNISKARSAKP